MNNLKLIWVLWCAFAVGHAWAAVSPDGFVADPPPLEPQKSAIYSLSVDGKDVWVEDFDKINYARFIQDGTNRIKVKVPEKISSYTISPRRLGIESEVEGDSLIFNVDQPRRLVIVINDRERLFVFAEKAIEPKAAKPDLIVPFTSGDPTGKTTSTQALREAIDSLPKNGVLVIPPGLYTTAPIRLKSDMTLHLSKGATIRLSSNLEDYTEPFCKLLDFRNIRNVRVEGNGTLDGNGEFLRTNLENPGRVLFMEESRHIEIEGVLQINSPSWNTNIVRSKYVTLRNIKVIGSTRIYNTDAIDPDSSSHVLIEDCFTYGLDDSIVVKSVNRDGKYSNVRNITARGNVLLTTTSALKVGTETWGATMKDIEFINNDILLCDRGMSIYARDGSDIKNIRVINNYYEDNFAGRLECMIYLTVKDRNNGGGNISNVLIKDCHFLTQKPNPSIMYGVDESNKISNIRIQNLRVAGEQVLSLEQPHFEIREFVDNVTIE